MEKLSFLAVIKIFFIFIFSTLAGCGGGGGESAPDQPATLQGVFLDSKVSGLFYRSGSLSGFTDSDGIYSYEAGATITFEIGGIVIGAAKAQPIMTPLSLVPEAVDETHPTVVNMVRLFITLDSDNNPSNGIQIETEVHALAEELSLDFTLVGSAFDNAANVQNVIALISGGNALATEQDARLHFETTLMGLLAGIYNGTYSGDDSGTWSIVVDSDGVITGSGCSTVALSEFDIRGEVTSDGELSSFGFASNGNFLGSFDASSGNFSGNWAADGDTGTYSGLKATSRSGEVCPNTVPSNTAPVANAGADRTVTTGLAVILDGSKSSDADGDTLTYQWSSPRSRSANADIIDSTSVNASFTPTVNGSYVIELVVNDGTVDSQVSQVIITAVSDPVPPPPADNTPPVANAGLDKTVILGLVASLDASKTSDADEDSLSYLWSLVSQPEGSDIVIADSSAIQTTFTPDTLGEYVFQLVINDGVNENVTDSITITVAEPIGFSDEGLVIYNTVMSDFASYVSADITIIAPSIAENGAVVPVTVNFPSQVSRLWLFIEPNDNPEALRADFLVANDNGSLSTRVKMKQTGDVIAVIEDILGNLTAAKANIAVTIGSSPAIVDCTVIDCAPEPLESRERASDGEVSLLLNSAMNTEDYIENIQFQVDGLDVLNIVTTPYLSKNPFFKFNYSSPAAGTSSELLIIVSSTRERVGSIGITVNTP